ncbi:uncharacterized protein KY384_001460 [Bacidia gigantensis]|uniref:uncharacterized protein n=1 Tax=Bacidia gigantensis TaxID=2732470 RepID=UPI001D059FBC|nr:uncharacterized protein KY384_001460 [Bacidia gigantensis]KAG8533719.1 hypothetical protein KY384_001460 [Bacidia gigantensis]
MRRTPLQRPPSYAKSRMSTYSVNSKLSERGSRPISQAFPIFHSSLPYSLVRDFAYPVAHPCHYGPPPTPSEPASGSSTPASDRHRRLSDPAGTAWDGGGAWGGGESYFAGPPLPQMAYRDGPPYSEDEDLHSPVVKSSRSRKSKGGKEGSEQADRHERRSFLTGISEDSTKTSYYRDEDESADGPGGELIPDPPDGPRESTLAPNRYRQQVSQPQQGRLNQAFGFGEVDDSEEDSLGIPERNDSRYSRDYQFTIASPDEEMHGKAVALFDFERENENELPLAEGQIIWVSYRHGQGWLVGEDPKTGDAGLVPEEYVRLLRDIEGGLGSLSIEGGPEESEEGSPENRSPTKPEHIPVHSPHSSGGGGHNEKNAAVVSSFSTSSKDLDPYPHHLLGQQTGQMPPQVAHYSSQSNTPTVRSPSGGGQGAKNFDFVKGSSTESRSKSEVKTEKQER